MAQASLDRFVQRRDLGNAEKIACHCDIPGLASFLVVDTWNIEKFNKFYTQADLYLDEKGFFFHYNKDYAETHEQVMKVLKDTELSLTGRLVDDDCLIQPTESVSPHEIEFVLKDADISKFKFYFGELKKREGIYSDIMSAKIPTFHELARLISNDAFKADYYAPFGRYQGRHFFNLDNLIGYKMENVIETIVLTREESNTKILSYRQFKKIQDSIF